MAVDVCSDASSSTASPRISFSHDLQDSDHIVPADDPFLFEPTIDFDFHFCTTAGHHTLSADELFANGQILPVEIKKLPAASPAPKTPPRLSNSDENRKMLKEFLSTTPESDEDSSPPAKHFWHFRRSSSLNSAGNGNGLVRQVRSLQFLSRSNSTGSAPTPKPHAPPRARRKQRSKSEPFISRSVSSLLFNTQSQSQSHLNCSKKNTNNSALKKSSSCRSSSGGHGVRISPVLNIPPNYISKTTFFGLGSFFCNGKSSKKKKRQL
nr:probable membrane-associated kinase regulator 3 [Ipomoea trifida]